MKLKSDTFTNYLFNEEMDFSIYFISMITFLRQKIINLKR